MLEDEEMDYIVHPIIIDTNPAQNSPRWLKHKLCECNEGEYKDSQNWSLLTLIWVVILCLAIHYGTFTAVIVVPLTVGLGVILWQGSRLYTVCHNWRSIVHIQNLISERFADVLPYNWHNTMRTDQAIGKVRRKIMSVVMELEKENPGKRKQNRRDNRFGWIYSPAILTFGHRLDHNKEYDYYADRLGEPHEFEDETD